MDFLNRFLHVLRLNLRSRLLVLSCQGKSDILSSHFPILLYSLNVQDLFLNLEHSSLLRKIFHILLQLFFLHYSALLKVNHFPNFPRLKSIYPVFYCYFGLNNFALYCNFRSKLILLLLYSLLILI